MRSVQLLQCSCRNREQSSHSWLPCVYTELSASGEARLAGCSTCLVQADIHIRYRSCSSKKVLLSQSNENHRTDNWQSYVTSVLQYRLCTK